MSLISLYLENLSHFYTLYISPPHINSPSLKYFQSFQTLNNIFYLWVSCRNWPNSFMLAWRIFIYILCSPVLPVNFLRLYFILQLKWTELSQFIHAKRRINPDKSCFITCSFKAGTFNFLIISNSEMSANILILLNSSNQLILANLLYNRIYSTPLVKVTLIYLLGQSHKWFWKLNLDRY